MAEIESPMTDYETVHNDIVAILNALGIGDHARPYSTHMVVHKEIIPEINRLIAELRIRRRESADERYDGLS